RELRETAPFARRPESDVTVIPCCVDLVRFRRDARERERVRAEKSWGSRVVLTYLGSIGSRYLPREMAAFFAAAPAGDPRFFFNVLTKHDTTSLEDELAKQGVGRDAYSIAHAEPPEVAALLSASDAGICFLGGTASRASSPTKIGEYLASGLPVVTNRWGGDY